MTFDWSALFEDSRHGRDQRRSWWSERGLRRAEDATLRCLLIEKRLSARPHQSASLSLVTQALNASGGVLVSELAERRFQ
jgi:hypothetical protein